MSALAPSGARSPCAVQREEALRQDAVVLHLGADRQEARGQLALRLGVRAAHRLRHIGRRRHQLLIDLRLVLPRDLLIVRLVHALLRLDLRAVVVPPQLARDLVAVFIDDDAGAVGAPGRPQHLVVHVEHAELQEGAAEADAGREFVPDPADHGDARVEHVTVVAHLADRDDRGLVHRLIEHRVFGGRDGVDALVAQHRIGLADAEDVGELPRHLEQIDVQPDERVLAEARALLQVDVLRRQRVLGLREVGVFLDRRDLAAVRIAVRVLVRHVAALTGLRLRAGAVRQGTVGESPVRKSLNAHSG